MCSPDPLVAIGRNGSQVRALFRQLLGEQPAQAADHPQRSRDLVWVFELQQALDRIFHGPARRLIERATFGQKTDRSAAPISRIGLALQERFPLQAIERRRDGPWIDVQQAGELSGSQPRALADATYDEALLRGHSELLLHATRELLELPIQLPEASQKIEGRTKAGVRGGPPPFQSGFHAHRHTPAALVRVASPNSAVRENS
jgi:hypothetical protein